MSKSRQSKRSWLRTTRSGPVAVAEASDSSETQINCVACASASGRCLNSLRNRASCRLHQADDFKDGYRRIRIEKPGYDCGDYVEFLGSIEELCWTPRQRPELAPGHAALILFAALDNS